MSRISNEDRLTIYELVAELVRRVIAGTVPFARARDTLVMLVEDRADGSPIPQRGKKDHPPKRDLANERLLTVESWYRGLGFKVRVPKPDASNSDFARWEREGKVLFYRPATDEVSYGEFMSSVGQDRNWAALNRASIEQLRWEPAVEGYWFTMEAAPVCPRLQVPGGSLSSSIALPCLEEYAIAFWMLARLDSVRIDISTGCILRTTLGFGPLIARSQDGRLLIRNGDAFDHSRPSADEGGRAVEIVANAA